jgi:predicted NBD/HSP70 family sugar kinase
LKVIGKPKLMRKINRELIVQAFRENQNLTNTELKKITGLSRRTINLIIGSLKDIGVVKESGYRDSTNEGGKKPVIYKFIPNSFYAIGVMVKDFKIVIVICNLNGEILFKDEVLIEWKKGNDYVCTQIIDTINSIIDKSKIDGSRFLGIGIGLHGLVDTNKGLIRTLTRHKNWENYDLVGYLKKHIDLPIEIQNGNHMRVLGEKWFGLAKNNKNFVILITINDGIGAGIVINNELMDSSNGLLGEVGHIKIIQNGISFNKLKDFEYYLGLKHVNQIIFDNMEDKSYSNSPIRELKNTKKEISFEDLFQYYNSNDEFSKIIVEKLSVYFSLLIEIIVCTYDPELIIIQGKFTLLEDKYFKKIANVVEKSLYPNIKKKIILKTSAHHKEISVLGAAGIVFDKVPI